MLFPSNQFLRTTETFTTEWFSFFHTWCYRCIFIFCLCRCFLYSSAPRFVSTQHFLMCTLLKYIYSDLLFFIYNLLIHSLMLCTTFITRYSMLFCILPSQRNIVSSKKQSVCVKVQHFIDAQGELPNVRCRFAKQWLIKQLPNDGLSNARFCH